MTLNAAENAIDTWRATVMKQPISKDMKGHIIEGLGINTPADPNDYEVYVIGQNLRHTFNFITKRLEDWLKDNGHM